MITGIYTLSIKSFIKFHYWEKKRLKVPPICVDNHIARFWKMALIFRDCIWTFHIRGICTSAQYNSSHNVLILISSSSQLPHCIINQGRPCLFRASFKATTTSLLTISEKENPLLHLISVPEAISVCCTGKEKVKPRSLCSPSYRQKFLPSFVTIFASSEAM